MIARVRLNLVSNMNILHLLRQPSHKTNGHDWSVMSCLMMTCCDRCIASLRGRVSIDTIKDEIPKIRKYLKQIYESDGFDIDEMPGISWYSTSLVKWVCCRKCRPEDYDKYMNLAQYAIDETYNKDNKEEFKVLRVNSVNATIAFAEAFHLTFTAQDVDKAGDIPACKRTFQALVLSWYTYGNKEEKFKRVQKCRLKF